MNNDMELNKPHNRFKSWEVINSTDLNAVQIRNIYKSDIKYILSLKWSELAKKYMRIKDWQPKYTLELNAWGEKRQRFLSDKLLGSTHTYIVWYCNVWWEIKVRTFRRSNSEGCRRAWLWEEKRSDWLIVISKWQNIKNATYETTTKVDYRIADKLDRIPHSIQTNLLNHPHSSVPGMTWLTLWHILTKQMNECIKIDKLYEKYPFSSSCGIIAWQDINLTKQWFKNINPRWINLESMKLKKDWMYSYDHRFLWIIDVHICEIDWNGTIINVHFANSRHNCPEKIRIDDITYPNAKINSFWTYDRQINAAPLTAKPIEYASQSPKWMELWHQVFEWYVDIRDLYQETPLIKKFKEILWIK